MTQGRFARWRSVVVIGALLAGCNLSRQGIEVPQWDPSAAADRAMSEYDSNGDGQLSRDELQACPGLLSAIAAIDRDGDGSVSADELKASLQELRQNEAALVEVRCVVTRGRRPLEGATVTLVPESLMGDAFRPASGVTSRNGTTIPTVADEELPAEYRGRIHGVHCGFYRVVVTHPAVSIPAKYNSQTELGRLVALRNREVLTVSF